VTQRIGNPFPMFFDRRGRPLTGGFIYIGAEGADPEEEPIGVYFDAALKVEAVQPIRTIGGVIVRDGITTALYTAADRYSLRVRDADGAEVAYLANALLDEQIFQPRSANLTALAQQTTTPYGRSLLAQVDAAGLRQHAGVSDAIPVTGGLVNGDLKRSGAGGWAYAADPALPRIRFLFTDNGAADPRSLPGDIWFEANP